MEPETPDDRPESPKKKIRPSSTTNAEVSHSDSQNATGSVGTSSTYSELNGFGLAPTRSGRRVEASSSSERNNSDGTVSNSLPGRAAASNTFRDEAASIQEEVVSSSENSVYGRKTPSYSDGDADSLTNEAEVLSRAAESVSRDSEADRKEL